MLFGCAPSSQHPVPVSGSIDDWRGEGMREWTEGAGKRVGLVGGRGGLGC